MSYNTICQLKPRGLPSRRLCAAAKSQPSGPLTDSSVYARDAGTADFSFTVRYTDWGHITPTNPDHRVQIMVFGWDGQRHIGEGSRVAGAKSECRGRSSGPAGRNV